jgi:hypothetical protein
LLPKWVTKGDYFEACNCEVTCPCIFLSPPTRKDCTVLLAWHIAKGKFEDTILDGLNVAMAIHSPGHMQKVKWKAAVYLDSNANNSQTHALDQIYGGRYKEFIGEVLGTRSVPIDYVVSGKKRSLSVSTIAALEIEDVVGPNGAVSSIHNAPFYDSVAYVAKSKRFTYSDYGMHWEISDRNGFHHPFSEKSS